MAEPTFTVEDVLTRVRLLRNASDYLESSACVWVTDALIELYTHSTVARQDPERRIREFVVLTAKETVVPCSIKFMPVLVDYVVGRAFMEDGDSASHSARGGEHFKLFYDRIRLIEQVGARVVPVAAQRPQAG